MEHGKQDVAALQARIEALEAENARLRVGAFRPSTARVVKVPAAVEDVFDRASRDLAAHFQRIDIDPARAMIGIGEDRYVLVRASALSLDFQDTLVQLYADRGEREALAIARGFLFDIAHTIGLHDARAMHEQLGSDDPLVRLSGGPVHFAYTGWGLVDIKEESHPEPGEGFCLIYEHTYSFESASFLRAGRASKVPVCILQAGYSSGWCEASFGLELTAVEVTCKARGDAACMFVMAPPHKIAARVREHFAVDVDDEDTQGLDIPTYFERKRAEEEVRESLRQLRATQEELLRKERLATVGLLVSGIAHEMNTPLGIAVTAASLVTDELSALEARFSEGKLTRADLRASLDRAGEASSLLTSNLERAAAHVTDFKRISMDHVTGERRQLDLGQHLRKTLDGLAPVIARGKLVPKLSAEAGLFIETHPGAIAQILTNLITNSATHAHPSPNGEHVGVEVNVSRALGGRVRLVYSDDGRGMPPETRERAFQPFFTTARGEGGTGLGLHLVRSLVTDALGGELTLTSTPGAGVCFTIEF